MPFLTQGKTNWKFIAIVIVLAVIVGGGILVWIKKQEVPLPEFPEIEKLEEVGEEEKIEVEVYFSNPEMYNKLQREICPGEDCPEKMYEIYGTDECGYFFPVVREIPKPKTETELVQLLIRELLKGATKEEQNRGFRPGVSPFIKMIKDFEIKNGTLTIRLDEEKITEWEKSISPRLFYSLSSCEWRGYIGSLTLTLSRNLRIEPKIIPSPM